MTEAKHARASRACLLAALVAVVPLAMATIQLSPAAANGADVYLDNRSGPAELLESLYNAINRREYARAYSYFDESAVPDFDAFEAGYADTGAVELALGEPAEEGAAGSTFWRVPAAVRASMTDGSTEVFAGCYSLRLAQPAIQSPPFRPLHIVKGELSPVPATDALEDAVPADCPE